MDGHVRREHEDADLRELLPYPLRRFEALRLVLGRHADVDDRQVGPVAPHGVEQLGRIPRLGDDIEAGALEQPGEALPQEDVVVGDDDALCHSRHRRIVPHAP